MDSVRKTIESNRNEWLRSGNVIVASTERAARTIRLCFVEAQRQAGYLAWATPTVHSWEGWMRALWKDLSFEHATSADETEVSWHRMVLTPQQETSVWSAIIERGQQFSSLRGGLSLAAMAKRTLAELLDAAPQFLEAKNRTGWSGDARIFSDWMGQFLRQCERNRWIGTAQLPWALLQTLERADAPGLQGVGARPEICLVGFDRLSEMRRRLLDRVCRWTTEDASQASARYFSFAEQAEEIAACFAWIREAAAAHPDGRWLIVSSQIERDRGEIERALHRYQDEIAGGINAEFTLGVPLKDVSMIRAATLLLRWQTEALEETELRWLLASDAFQVPTPNVSALAECFEELQRSDMARTEWSLLAFCRSAQRQAPSIAAWCEGMLARQKSLLGDETLLSMDVWCERMRVFLDDAGWLDGSRLNGAGLNISGLDSVSYQAKKQWEELLEACAGTAAVSGAHFSWEEALTFFNGLLDDALFAAERALPQVQITGPAEAAGLVADGIWFLGADSSQWPAQGNANPLLPLALQKEAQMPHASLEIDLKNATVVTERLLGSADQIVFSFPLVHEDGPRRPSSLLSGMIGDAKPFPSLQVGTEMQGKNEGARVTVAAISDAVSIPFRGLAHDGNSSSGSMALRGGASVLVDQSNCPFRAFARHRLAAVSVQPAMPGISARLRGKLLHDAMRRIWGEKDGLQTQSELLDCMSRSDEHGLEALVQRHVQRTFQSFHVELSSEAIPASLVRMERERLVELICSWLRYEARREPFTVDATEQAVKIEIAGISLQVRQDRIDRVGDRRLILDYKTSQHTASSWLGERPEDVQLPLYALSVPKSLLEGIAFANVTAKASDCGVNGMLVSARETLQSDLSASSSLVRNPLEAHHLHQWRATIERLVQEYLNGIAQVDPKEFPKTCENCGLESFCRVSEVRGIDLEGEAHDE